MVLSLCVDRAGYRAGSRVAQFIFEWELVVRSTGGPIRAEEYSAWWKIGATTGYRRLAEFRAAFPELGEHGMPHDLMRPLLDRLAAGEVPAGEDVPLMVPR